MRARGVAGDVRRRLSPASWRARSTPAARSRRRGRERASRCVHEGGEEAVVERSGRVGCSAGSGAREMTVAARSGWANCPEQPRGEGIGADLMGRAPTHGLPHRGHQEYGHTRRRPPMTEVVRVDPLDQAGDDSVVDLGVHGLLEEQLHVGRPEFGQVREFGSGSRRLSRGPTGCRRAVRRWAITRDPQRHRDRARWPRVGDIETHGLMIGCATVARQLPHGLDGERAAMAQRLARISARRTWSAGRRGPDSWRWSTGFRGRPSPGECSPGLTVRDGRSRHVRSAATTRSSNRRCRTLAVHGASRRRGSVPHPADPRLARRRVCAPTAAGNRQRRPTDIVPVGRRGELLCHWPWDRRRRWQPVPFTPEGSSAGRVWRSRP